MEHKVQRHFHGACDGVVVVARAAAHAAVASIVADAPADGDCDCDCSDDGVALVVRAYCYPNLG